MWRVSLLCLVLLIAVPAGRGSGAQAGLDAVIAVDTSGSMKRTDPRNLKVQAPRIFISLLEGGNSVAIVAFDSEVRVLAGLSDVSKERNRLLRSLKGISSTGAHTDIYGAIVASYRILRGSRKESRIIVLMTDGRMDLGDPGTEKTLLRRMFNEVLPELTEAGIRIYTIAFGRGADSELLKEIALKTGGFFYFIDSDDDLHIPFTDIYSKVMAPDSLPVRDERFYVDGAVEELTLVMTKGTSLTEVSLESPEGVTYTYSRHPGGVRWYRARTHEVVTIKRPPRGTWFIRYSAGRGSRAFIITGLNLMTTFDRYLIPEGREERVEVWLQQQGEALAETSLLLEGVVFSAEVDGPAGEGMAVELRDDGFGADRIAGDGVYTGLLGGGPPGEYIVRFTAKGKTFEREKSYTFAVVDAPVRGGPAGGGEEVVVSAADGQEGVSWRRVILRFAAVNAGFALLVSMVLLYRRWKVDRG